MLDRTLQRQILETLAKLYPEGSHDVTTALESTDPDERKVMVNVQYLAEHGLLSSGYRRRGMISDDRFMVMSETCITARGLDFLQDDGGLGAILGVVTIKINTAQWAELLAKKIEALESISHDERSSIAQALRKLPATAIEKVSEKMLDWAVDHAQDALPLLRMLLNLGAA